MAKYMGVSGIRRKIKEEYMGVSGTRRKIKEEYMGVSGTRRLVYKSTKLTFKLRNDLNNNT